MGDAALRPEVSRTILVVEPNVELRASILREIKDAGFLVASAGSGDEALGILQRRSDIGLVFTAINIPGSIDGVGLAVRIHRDWPDLAIVITSAIVSLRQSALPRRCRFMKKPYRADEAIRCFRLLLGSDALGPHAVGTAVSMPDLRVS